MGQANTIIHRAGSGTGYLAGAKALLHRGRVRDSLSALTRGLRKNRANMKSLGDIGSSTAVNIEAAEAEALRARLLIITGKWEAVRSFLAHSCLGS